MPTRALIAAMLSCLLALGGCSGGTSSAPAATAAGGAPQVGAADKADAPVPAPGSGTDASASERKMARTASLTLVIADPAKSAKALRAAAEGLGGYLVSESIVTEQKDGFYVMPSTVTVAVPSAKLDDALDALSAIGEARNRVVTAEDVTTEVVDVDARIKTLRDSIARIEALMARAGSVTEIAQVESELTSRQSQLESLVAQQAALGNRVAMAPVTVTLRTAATVVEPNPLLQGLEAGWTALLQSLRILITMVGALLPFAVIGGLVWALVAAWRRGRRPRPATVVQPAPTVVQPTPPVGVPVVPDAAASAQAPESAPAPALAPAPDAP